MKVIILAAGKENRIFEHENLPKSLLMLGEETIIERQIHLLNSVNINNRDIIVIAGFRHQEIVDSLPDSITVIENQKYNQYDNSYSLYLGLQPLQDYKDDILVLDGDIFFTEDTLEIMCNNSTDWLLLKSIENRYGDTGVSINSLKKVTEIGKHIENTQYIYTGIMKLSLLTRTLLYKEIESGHFNSWYSIPLNDIISQLSLHGKICNDFLTDINSMNDYRRVKQFIGIEPEKIMITGASGLLGNKLFHILKRNYNCIGIQNSSSLSYLDNLDLLDYEMVKSYLTIHKPTTIIHSAAIADPDTCEKNKELADQININIVQRLCNLADEMGIKMIFISTDYVFDGESEELYKTDSIRNPKNYYGKTKKQAEDIVSLNKSNLIVRIPIIYGYNDEADKQTFVTKTLRQLRANEVLSLDNNQIRYPVLIDEVAMKIENNLMNSGIIHITSDKAVTKYSWAKEIAEVYGLNKNLVKIQKESSLIGRPEHIHLQADSSTTVSDINRGLTIMKNQQTCAFQLIYKSEVNHSFYNKNVAKFRMQLGRLLCKQIPFSISKDIDVIVPVPSTGRYYAMGLAETMKKPYVEALIKPDKKTRSFQISDIMLREEYIRDKIYPISELIKEKNLMLVDEAIFTGITLKVICDMVKACGAKKIYIAIPTPLSGNLCDSYVQPERNILSSEYDSNNAVSYFKIDGVFFQNKDVFTSSIKDIDSICYHCFEQEKK